MARVIAALIRHGEYHQLTDTPSAHQPFPLTDAGRRQAARAARILRTLTDRNGWQLHPVIDSSRMLRAWQSAKIIATETEGLYASAPRLESFDALAERGVGSAANLTVRQIEEILSIDPRCADPPANWKADSHYQLPLQGAESLLQAGARVAAHLAVRMALVAEEVERDTLKLFVGHGAAFRHAAFHLGLLEFGQIAGLSMYHARPVCIGLDGTGASWRLVAGEWKIRARKSEYND